LGAQKLDKLRKLEPDIVLLDQKYKFAMRIEAERVAIKHADIIFTSTVQEQKEQYTHPLYKDLVADKKKNFVVAPPGANTRVFSSDEQSFDEQFHDKFSQVLKRDLASSRLDLPSIISASRLDPKKNHLGLVKAYAKDQELQEKANLVISLRGTENAYEDYSNLKEDEIEIMNQIMHIIKSTGIEKKVCFISINSQTELAAFYRYMVQYKSIFTLTALYEPFGLAPIEAMSTGLPAAVTKYGGPADVLYESGKKFGVLIDAFDEADIARGLKEVIDNHESYQKLGIERVNAKYTWHSTAKTYANEISKQIHKKMDYQTIQISNDFKDAQSNEINLDFIKKTIQEMEN
jgi:sucrose-phosphate synthase